MVPKVGYGRAGRGRMRTTLASMMAAVLLLAMFAGTASAHNAIATCGGFLQLDYPSKTADITRTSDDPDTLVYDNVNGGGKYAVTPGTYKVAWSDGYVKSNLVVNACPTPVPTPTPTPVPTPTPTPVPTPTPTPVPTPTPTPVPTPTPTPVPTPTPTPVPTPTPTPVPTPTPTPVPTPTPTPVVTPTPTPVVTPTPTPQTELFGLPSFSKACGGSVTVTNFAGANVEDVLVTPGGLVITADGTFPLAPGNYEAVGRVGGQVVTEAFPFTIEACPTATPSGTVVAETGTPRITPPPTDSISDAGSTGPGTGLGLVLVILGAASLALLPVTNRRARRR